MIKWGVQLVAREPPRAPGYNISTGIFPERLKFSEVSPLFKKGDISEFSNYRPISLLTSFSKIIEKLFLKDCIII